MIPSTIYYIISGIIVLGVLIGISMMSKVKAANSGNTLSAICTLFAIVVVLYDNQILTAWQAWIGMAIGAVIGIIGAYKVKMIQMPQAVALLNGLGGLASALVAILTIQQATDDKFAIYVGAVALLVGWVTFTGSLVAAGKLHKLLPQKPVVWKAHSLIVAVTLIATLAVIVFIPDCIWIISILSAFFGVAFAIRVGGADMPITISLLNSLSGVAGGIAGIAVGDPLLVAIGGIVGASGLLLTQIMCKAMNRSLISILLGSAPKKASKPKVEVAPVKEEAVETGEEAEAEITVEDILSDAKKVIIVPGYGMALAQAQSTVKALSDKLESKGAEVKFAIHPVAGRMPGHMNVLLCEVDVPYDKLYEMDAINGEFKDCDVAIIVGANDVINPAANTAEGTPIYGMPVLNVADAKNVIICNFDTKPGYAGVPNPLYESESTIMMLGDAKETVAQLTEAALGKKSAPKAEETISEEITVGDILSDAKKVIIVPGYGMALAQAQSTVKALCDKLESKGAEVKFAIHPVAGRMPGHMNVLLCEVDVPYDKLYEMDAINGEFKDCDVAIIVGANDVINPAANTAEGTPIYGMPVLNVADAKNVIICNFDTKPGYAGVPNPLYESESTIMMLGDAKETVAQLTEAASGKKSAPKGEETISEEITVGDILSDAKKVIIVPGYGMALAQAQSTVKALSDKLESKGAEVKFAIHPVAGRMPGHMNVLLCEVDVPYDKLYEMDAINGEFKDCDVAIIVGANDVINPAANTAEGTPIYGMPVLNVADAKNVIICNFDTKPGYAGVPNPLYESESTIMMLGDAKETIAELTASV